MIRSRARTTALAGMTALLAGCLAVPPEAGAPPAGAGPAATAIALEPYAGRLRSIGGLVGDRQAVLLFDSGGGWTILSPELARHAGCEPAGRAVGLRMTGERIEAPLCADVPLQLGGYRRATGPAAAWDLMALLPAGLPRVDGVVSLDTFAGRTITLDLAHERILVETAESARARTRTMQPLQLRLTTGADGSELLAFVGVPAAGTTLWLLVDSGNLDDVVVAPHAARLLGLAGDAPAGTVRLPLAPGFAVDTRVRVRDLIYDGALSEAVLRRATWTLDLATGQGWVQP